LGFTTLHDIYLSYLILEGTHCTFVIARAPCRSEREKHSRVEMLLTALALTIRTPTRVPVQMCTPLEESLLNLLQPGSTPVQEEVAKITTALAASAGQDQPALSPLIEGEWVLLHTSKSTFDARNPLGRREDGTSPGLEGAFAVLSGGAQVAAPSSSPIQRALVDAFSVTQSITLQGSDKRVLQSVETPLGTLRLGARASVSSEQPARISFTFDEGYFAVRAPLFGVDRLPYPVPFRLLGKEAEGYLDTVYLSDKIRISVGNKGTQFVLRRA
jgi:hypothetical protein